MHGEELMDCLFSFIFFLKYVVHRQWYTAIAISSWGQSETYTCSLPACFPSKDGLSHSSIKTNLLSIKRSIESCNNQQLALFPSSKKLQHGFKTSHLARLIKSNNPSLFIISSSMSLTNPLIEMPAIYSNEVI